MAGGMTTGQLMSMFSYTMQILMSLMMLSNDVCHDHHCPEPPRSVSWRSWRKRAISMNPASPVMEVDDGSVVFDHVDFSYAGDTRTSCACQAINLSIQSGETVGIIGGTGSVQELPGAAHSTTV